MTFHIISIFPEIFSSYFNESIIKRAQEKNAIEIKYYDLRNWTDDKHRSVDDTPFGGGAGMLMKIEPLYRAINDIKLKIPVRPAGGKSEKLKIILLSARGTRWTQQIARTYSTTYSDVILICGRYEGVDERIKEFIDEEISIGDYVLTGGELGAMVLVDSIARLLPGVLGNDASAVSESHSTPGVLEYPQYTRPEVFVDNDGKTYEVPKVLLSGNHAEIEKWNQTNQMRVQ